VRRALIALAITLPIASGGLWYGVNHVPGFGPWLADALRAVLGTEAVSRLEDWAYGAEDRWNRFWRRGERPKQLWEVPPSPAASAAPADQAPAGADGGIPAFRPADVGPLFAGVAAPGDGVWVPVALPEPSSGPPLLYKTLLHPDARRPWAELFVVAIDLRRADLFVVAGTDEPRAEVPEARSHPRSGLVPEQHRAAVLAAFNGGFKAEHGHYGMMVDGVTFIKPRDIACTVAAHGDGSLRIGTWTALAGGQGGMTWWRQAPPCLVEGGKLHPALTDENTNWGAALGGGTVVRRSALGLDAGRVILYMGVSNATTARAIAVGMQHAGAVDVAELDINWSYPRFVLFRPTGSGEREGFGLFAGFSCNRDEYVRQASPRDFFYLVRREPGPRG
jgi:hypothetical protein